ncbi:hypothetical protein GWI33_016846 [Rhynchophorus ferrugineus]|uniref:Uncharacterized protein n=1 Tax=Rhynchophorus ferrugineus TaxID=354439 RepID=A0A834I122_RHYFE|nr:hypothetical protein GWI33_016846 [Rhynchophorus ferrugineus]
MADTVAREEKNEKMQGVLVFCTGRDACRRAWLGLSSLSGDFYKLRVTGRRARPSRNTPHQKPGSTAEGGGAQTDRLDVVGQWNCRLDE